MSSGAGSSKKFARHDVASVSRIVHARHSLAALTLIILQCSYVSPLHMLSPAGFTFGRACNFRLKSTYHARTFLCLSPNMSLDGMSRDNKASLEADERVLEDLLKAGNIRIWRKNEAPRQSLAGGARGAGHSRETQSNHVEPDIIYVIGTSHTSEESAKQVEALISIVQPDNVVVELCRSRAGIMYADNMSDGETKDAKAQPSIMSLTGSNYIQTLTRSLSLGGGTAFLLRALLAQSPLIKGIVGTSVGADFRAARKAGENCSAQIVLGDRPIEITLERAWRSLSTSEKIRGATGLWEALRATDKGSLDVDKQLADAAQTGGQGLSVVDRYEQLLGESFPGLIQPLIKERDVFLSLTMKSSMAVNGCQKVVGVVGLGHLEGVFKCLNEDHSDEFKTLTWTPSRDALKKKIFGIPQALVQRIATDTVIGLVLYAAWLQFFAENSAL